MTRSMKNKKYVSGIVLLALVTFLSAQKKGPGTGVEGTVANMVLVEGGEFSMGSADDVWHADNGANEKPVHQVTLYDFYISKYDVTVKDFEIFVNETGYKTEAERCGYSSLGPMDNLQKVYGLTWRCNGQGKVLAKKEKLQPVVFVTWNDANEYCKWLSQKTGRKFRLPTEAEWEYAARGGKQSKGYSYPGGNDIDSVAWTGDNSGKTIHPVGQKKPNELGLYDMCGNVYQWISDWDSGIYYSISPPVNPKGPECGTEHIIRGGAWNRPGAAFHRMTLRHSRTPETSNFNCGFRIAADK